jgi:hypothetical protein
MRVLGSLDSPPPGLTEGHEPSASAISGVYGSSRSLEIHFEPTGTANVISLHGQTNDGKDL